MFWVWFLWINIVFYNKEVIKKKSYYFWDMVRISYDRRFEFGKYKGLSVMEVIYKDPQYMEYMSSILRWLFTDREMQTLRNLRNRQKNKDIHMSNVRTRTPFEEEMYKLYRKNQNYHLF